MDSQGAEAKEATIMSLVEDAVGQSHGLLSIMQERIFPNPDNPDSAKSEGRPTNANVLDEVIDQLRMVNRTLVQAEEFFLTQVANKIM